ncbi:MAG: class I SAM-dependent methyltransferase [Candidatus Aenigmatarchaeota archaeon]|nr:MAG: class I SAM-dependent methyltransferase [Candidatus Aenigmarchaeota archaeon]
MNPEEYSEKYIHFYTEDIPKLLLKFLNKTEWKSYLDLGCGDGSLLYALNKKGYFNGKKVYAIDLSENRIKLVKKINRNFKCFVDNACNIKNIKSKSIEFLVSTHVIEHVPNDEDMVKEINRVLAKNGTAYISTVFKKWYGWCFHKCNGKWVLDPTHVREYTDERQLLSMLRNHGFEIIESKKSLLWFSILELLFMKLRIRKRDIFENFLLKLLRNLKLPLPGYYNWQIVCKKVKDK